MEKSERIEEKRKKKKVFVSRCRRCRLSFWERVGVPTREK